MPSALRIKGDITKMPQPQKGLNKRILAKSTPLKECPRCHRMLPFDKFLRRTFESVNRGLPTATPTVVCTSCKQQRRRGQKRTRVSAASGARA